jgi:hypothetical protein
MMEMLEGLETGPLLAVIAIFLLLAANFQSFRLSLIVMLTIPSVLAGVALALRLTDTTLNIESASSHPDGKLRDDRRHAAGGRRTWRRRRPNRSARPRFQHADAPKRFAPFRRALVSTQATLVVRRRVKIRAGRAAMIMPNAPTGLSARPVRRPDSETTMAGIGWVFNPAISSSIWNV